MAQKTSTQVVQNLVINKVDSKAAFEQMQANNQINANELYLVQEQAESVMVVEFSQPETEVVGIDCNKTYNEILTALNNNKPIIGYFLNEVNDTKIALLPSIDTESSIIFISSPLVQDGEVWVEQIEYSSNGRIVHSEQPLSTEQTNATLTIGSYTYDGSTNVSIPVYDGTYTWG